MTEEAPEVGTLLPDPAAGHPDELQLITTDAGDLRIGNSPLPEYTTISRELWDKLPVWSPETEWPPGTYGPGKLPNAWLEQVQHADENASDDGYVLHIEALNVACSYRFGAPADPIADDNAEQVLTGVLVSWGER